MTKKIEEAGKFGIHGEDPCRCPAYRPEEPQGPLPALLLADTADQLADSMKDFAGELNIFGVQFENDSAIVAGYSKLLVRLAARIRAEDKRNQINDVADIALEGKE